MSRKIVLLIDGSPGADHAFAYATKNVIRAGDHVTLVAIAVPDVAGLTTLGVDLDEASGMIPDDAEMDKAKMAAHDKMEKLLEKFMATPTDGWEIDGKVLPCMEGIGETAVEFIKTHGATEVVIGSRGLGAIQRTLMNMVGLGSVSDYVVHHSPCPVVVVRPEQSAA